MSVLVSGPVAPISSHQLLIFLMQVGVLLLLALLLGKLANRIGMPAIVGELSAGVLVGPSVLAHAAPGLYHWLLPHDPAQLHLLDAAGQIGVLLLVGLTGIYMDLGLVRKRGLTAARISISSLIIPLGLGVTAGLLLPASMIPDATARHTFALFMGVAMCVSAIPVIAKTLMDLRLLHRNIGQLTLCSVMIDDIIGWLLLSVVSAMATTGVRAGHIGMTIGYLGIIAACALIGRPFVRAALHAADRSDRVRGNGSTVALVATLILLSAAATQAMGLEGVFGAFICGLLISSCRAVDPARLAPLRMVVASVLAPLFFATAGLRMDLTALAKPTVLVVGLIVLAAAIVGKFVGAYAGARSSRLNHWEALAVGAGVNARGVIEVIIAMVGLRLGVLTPAMYTIVVLVAIVTSLIAPPVLRVTMARVEHTSEEQLRTARYEVEVKDLSGAGEHI